MTNRRQDFVGRRHALRGAAGAAAIAGIGAPAIVGAQAQVLKIGHLTPLTGFLGPIGEYAVMGVKLAVEEANEAGGVLGRKIELISEDSVNPQTASTKAQRMIERDGVDVLLGEISSASGLAIAQVSGRTGRRSSRPAATRTSCAARRATASCSTSRPPTRCT